MKMLSIKEKRLKAIRYDIMTAHIDCGIRKHPLKDMESLRINLIAAVPETIGDCWICLTDYQGELPKYIKEIELKVGDWYWKQMCDLDIVE